MNLMAADAQQSRDHVFRARGMASLIRLLRPSTLVWRGRGPITIPLHPATELETRQGCQAIPGDLLVVRPRRRISLEARVADAAYLVSWARVRDAITSHFLLEVQLRPDWADNVWPDYVAFYARHGRWPKDALEVGPIFADVLSRGTGAEQTAHIRAQPWGRRLRMGGARSAAARIARKPVARGLAHAHYDELAAILRDEHRGDMLERAARLARLLHAHPRGCAVITARWEDDALLPQMPPELARAERITIRGAAVLEVRESQTDRLVTTVDVEDAVIGPGGGFAVPGPVQLDAEGAHLCMETGGKRAYGARMPAPIVCKGTHVRARVRPNRVWWWRRLQYRMARWSDAEWTPHGAQDARHLRVTATGEET